MDKAKNDEPKNFAFVTFQREEISRKLVCLFNIGMLPTAHTGQTGRRRHVRNKNCYQAGDISIDQRTPTEFSVMGQVITKDPAMGQGAQHQMGGPIGGQGLMGGAPMPRLAITIPYSTIPNTLLFTTQHDHYMWAGPRVPCMWAILF